MHASQKRVNWFSLFTWVWSACSSNAKRMQSHSTGWINPTFETACDQFSTNLGTDIFLHSQVSTIEAWEEERQSHHLSIYLCIQPYVPLWLELSNVNDSYRKFGFAGGFLSEWALGAPIVVDYSSIISHVAVTPVEIRGCEGLHVLPMDRAIFHFTNRGGNLMVQK